MMCLFNCSIPNIRILIINTGVPRSTKKMVAGVREKYNKVHEMSCHVDLHLLDIGLRDFSVLRPVHSR